MEPHRKQAPWMVRPGAKPWTGYAVAVGGTALATLVRWAIGLWWSGEVPPFITFYPVVMAAAVIGGTGAGVMASFLGGLAADYFFIPPIGKLWPITPGHMVGMGLFVGINLAISVIGGRLRAAYSHSRLQAVALESTANAIAITDRDGVILWVNSAFERLTGYSASETMGQNPRVFKSGRHERVFFRQMWDTIQAGRVWHGELVNKRKDGNLYDEEMTITPVKDSRGVVTHFIAVKQDVTERRRAEEASAKLAAIVESSNDAIVGTTLEGVITSWNAAAEGLFGYSAAEVIGHPASFIVPPDRQKEEVMLLGRLRAGEPVNQYETVRLTRDGRRINALVTISPVRDRVGRLVGASKIIRDITHRRQAEEAIRQSQERLTLATLAAQLGTWDWDIVTDELAWSARCLELFGLSPETRMTYRRFIEAVHPEDRARIDQAVRTAWERQEAYDVEMRTLWPDGTLHWVASRGRAYHDPSGRLTRMSGVAMDITERKRAEESLAKTTERLNGIISSAMDAIISINAKQHIVLFNPAAEKMFGVQAKQALGSSINAFIPERFRAAHTRHVEAFSRTGVSSRSMGHLGSLSGLRSNGEEFPIEASISQTEVGGEKLLTVILRDITDRKRAEEALVAVREDLARANADLERKVQDRTVKLRQTIEELEGFSYSLVHDMRAPLRAMQNFAALAQEACGGGGWHEALDYFQRIRTASMRLDQLITDALDYSKVMREELPVRPVDVAGLLRGILETYPNLQPAAADIRMELDVLTVLGNEAALTQVFSNLLGNAVKFVAPSVKPRVRVWAETVHTPQSIVRIWVEDNGIGIAKGAEKKIFGMFQRMHHTEEYPGTGVGLAIVRKAMERMGGRVGVESELGKGSRFWIELAKAA